MATQRDDAWLKAATPEEIAAAYDAGELEELQTGVVRSHPEIGSVPGLQHDQAWVDAMPADRVAAAFEAGELDALLGRIPWPQADEPAKPSVGVYGDGTIVTHTPTPRGDIPHEVGSATVLGRGVDPKDA